MKHKFIYVDDEDEASIEPIAAGLSETGLIEVELFRICELEDKSFDGLVRALVDSEYDGLILDLRLDDAVGSEFFFRAPAVAQELRSRAAEGRDLAATPIILCSTDAKMRATYDSDRTSHDLFDYKFEKGGDTDWQKISKKLCDLASGYVSLNANNVVNVAEILNRENFEGVDERIIQALADPCRLPSVHDRASFIIKSLFHHPGALIKERLLAARLGVDISGDLTSWNKLKEDYLAAFRYSGVFSTGWQRWWADSLIDWFHGIGGQSIESICAEDRVAILNGLEGVDGLIAAKPLKHCNSAKFWTVCEGYKQPMDPLEGFMVYEKSELSPWQENRHVSLDAILERIGVERGLRPHQSELENIKIQKEVLEDE